MKIYYGTSFYINTYTCRFAGLQCSDLYIGLQEQEVDMCMQVYLNSMVDWKKERFVELIRDRPGSGANDTPACGCLRKGKQKTSWLGGLVFHVVLDAEGG